MLKSLPITEPYTLNLPGSGRLCFAIAMMGFGILHFVYGEFVIGRAPTWPSSVPGRVGWAYISGLIMAAAGISVIIRKKNRLFLITAAVMVFVWAFLRHLPVLLADLRWGGDLTNAGKALTLWGGILSVTGTFPAETGRGRLSTIFTQHDMLITLGRICLAIFLIICGIEHFIFVDFIEQLVPAWIPGNTFWAYFTGIALIAGGLGLLIRKTLTVAGLLTGTMIFVWFAVLHIPRAISASSQNAANEWTSVCESLAFSGLAFVLAGMNMQKDK